MWLVLAALALILGAVSLVMLLKAPPVEAPPGAPRKQQKADARLAPAKEEHAPRVAPEPVPHEHVSPVREVREPSLSQPPAKTSLLSKPPAPPELGHEGFDDVTYISNRAHLVAELRPITPTYADDGAASDTKSGKALRANGAFRATRGSKRERHEDAFCVLPSAVYAIADGAGGHAAGNVASRTAIQALEAAVQSGDFPRAAFLEPAAPAAEALVGAVMKANAAVYAKANTDAGLAGMGTTLLALKVDADRERVYIAHVGDSRCYRVRGGKLTQLTKDHVVVEKDAAGRQKALLARALGAADRVDVDLVIGLAMPDDRYLLCTDGLHRALDEGSIGALLTETPDLHDAVGKLVARAEANDGSDNISVVLVELKG